jgi:hypothetical protein
MIVFATRQFSHLYPVFFFGNERGPTLPNIKNPTASQVPGRYATSTVLVVVHRVYRIAGCKWKNFCVAHVSLVLLT